MVFPTLRRALIGYDTPMSLASVPVNEQPSAVVAYVRDLFFGVRIQDVVEEQGGRALIATTGAAFDDALQDQPGLILVEMGASTESDWQEALRRAQRAAPGAAVIAFGSHRDAEARRVARAAGAHHVWAKSRFAQELPALVADYLRPSLDVQGCAELPNADVRRGVEAFNRGDYFDCHEILEIAWRDERRPCRALYQGILQLAIALYHGERRNFAGARKMLRHAQARLASLPAVCQGIDVAALLRFSAELERELATLDPRSGAVFPCTPVPQIALPD